MQYVLRYTLKPGSAAEHQLWLADHEEGTMEGAGWNYVGTWFNLSGLAAYDYESRWELDEQSGAPVQVPDKDACWRMSPGLSFIETGDAFFLGSVIPVHGATN